MTTGLEQRIRDSFLRQSMMQTFGADLCAVSPGVVTIAAPILPGSRQQHGVAHAALTFALGDTAAGYAGLTTLDDGLEVMTAEMKINLLAPGTGSRLRAEGRVLKSGRRLVVVAADVFAEHDGGDTLIAALQGTLIPVAPAG